MMLEYIEVTYPTTRSVYVDGLLTGVTNNPLRVEAGTHRFDLGTPVDYKPVSQNIVVTETTPLCPMEISFTKNGV